MCPKTCLVLINALKISQIYNKVNMIVENYEPKTYVEFEGKKSH